MIRRLWARLVDPARARPPRPPGEPPARLGPFSLHRPAGDADRTLLFAAYASSRDNAPDLRDRHPDSQRAVLEHEFESRQLGYPIDFPGVEFFLLRLGGEPAGRIYLQLTPTLVFVVDLVLLPFCRGRGHGTALLRDLIDHAHGSGRSVRLHVAKNNPRAAALYQRLGFRPVAELDHHHLLELPPGMSG
jgi:ribosomal protein S18 acetylase RimI-like enzyme